MHEVNKVKLLYKVPTQSSTHRLLNNWVSSSEYTFSYRIDTNRKLRSMQLRKLLPAYFSNADAREARNCDQEHTRAQINRRLANSVVINIKEAFSSILFILAAFSFPSGSRNATKEAGLGPCFIKTVLELSFLKELGSLPESFCGTDNGSEGYVTSSLSFKRSCSFESFRITTNEVYDRSKVAYRQTLVSLCWVIT